MEVVAMHASHHHHKHHHPIHSHHHHTEVDSPYIGSESNIFLNSLAGPQHREEESQLITDDDPQGLEPSPALQRGRSAAHHGSYSPHHSDYADDIMDSPDLSNVSWEDFAATSWDTHAQMLEQQGHGLQLHLPPHGRTYPGSKATTAPITYQQSEHPLLSAHSMMSAPSPMEYSLSTSTSPGPEMPGQEAFTSPLTPGSFEPEPASHIAQARNAQPQHRHMKSTPSPSRSQVASPELLRRRSAPTGSKNAGAVGKVSKGSPKAAGPTSNPSNARSAHSAIERKYRENINSKIAELHKALYTAGPSLFPDQDMDAGGYPYSRLPRADEDDCSGVESSSTSGQTVLPAKKADVLAGAISYVRRSEREKKLLVDQLNSMTAQLQHLEAIVQGRNTNIA